MARAAILDLLRGDTQLQTLGGDGFTVEPQYSTDQRPNATGAFIVICWRPTDYSRAIQANAEQHFDLYVHIPALISTVFGRIDDLLDRVDDIFTAAQDDGVDPTVGEDGWQLDYIGFAGRGPDFKDEDYQTICKQASYYALSSKAP